MREHRNSCPDWREEERRRRKRGEKGKEEKERERREEGRWKAEDGGERKEPISITFLLDNVTIWPAMCHAPSIPPSPLSLLIVHTHTRIFLQWAVYSRNIIRTSNGLRVIGDLLNNGHDAVVRAAATALRNLAIDPRIKANLGMLDESTPVGVKKVL